MEDLPLHNDTKRQMSDFIESPSHALILEGTSAGSSLHLANKIAADLLNVDLSQLKKAHLLILEPTNYTISIDQIRTAKQFMKLKTIGNEYIRRVIIINSAENLTIEAQNSLLKMLEETPKDSLIILTTSNLLTLLPTIRSRAQRITVKQMSLNELTLPLFERLLRVDELYKDKAETAKIIDSLVSICQAALDQASAKNDSKLIARWHKTLKSVVKAKGDLPKNPNSKLMLSDLLLSL